MKKFRIILPIMVMLMFFCGIPCAHAGKSYYKDLSMTIHNPETAKGKVYLTTYSTIDKDYCKISEDTNKAKVEGSIAANGKDFKVKFFALPNDGYVLDCLTTPQAYKKKDYYSMCIAFDNKPVTSDDFILDSDTTQNCYFSRPAEGSYRTPTKSFEYYAIFVPSKKMNVRCTTPGSLEKSVKGGAYGEDVNDLIVTGTLNEQDLKYLKKLATSHALVRLDLSGANITELPDRAFSWAHLYELKLPSTLKKIGDKAFAYNYGLKPVTLPKNAELGENLFEGCKWLDHLGIKDPTYVYEDDGFDFWDLL